MLGILSAGWACAKRLGRILPVLLLFMAGATPSAPGTPDGDRPRRVLMVHSFGGSVPPFTTHSTAFEEAIKHELGADVDLDQVSLENARYAQADLEEAFAEFLAKRLRKWQPDLVVPAGAPAGRFVAKYRDRLFPGTPVLYSWVDIRTLPAEAITKNATFVGQEFHLNELVEDMQQLDPQLNNVVMILGATPLERYWTTECQKAFAPFTGRVKFTYVNELSFEQILDLVSKLPPHSFVQLGLMMRDASGVTFNQDEVLKRLNAVSSAPVNGMFGYQVGRGIVGGRLFQDEVTGVETARIGARILRGEPASGFPPKVIPPGTPTYDWRELKRWGISDSRLPPGSIVLFRQPTVWELYQWHVAATVALIATQAALIFALLFQRRRRNLAEVAQMKAQAEVQEKREALEHIARVATLGELTATLTHELKQPLNAIIGNTALAIQFLDAPQPNLQEARESLTDIGNITRRAGELIQGMRDMLKRDTPGFTRVDLTQVIRTVDLIVHSDAISHRIAVELDLPPDLPPIKGDIVQLQQVILNLMFNAFSAMSGPEIKTRRLIVRAKPIDGSSVLIEAQDSGTGIPPDKLESIFDPFITSKPDGLGIGLSICRSIIERHGGKMWAANNPDRGATFSITLPASRD